MRTVGGPSTLGQAIDVVGPKIDEFGQKGPQGVAFCGGGGGSVRAGPGHGLAESQFFRFIFWIFCFPPFFSYVMEF